MAKRNSIRALSGKKIADTDFAGLGREMRHASDRTAAIVLAATVERELEQWIVSVLPRRDSGTVGKLQERDGALSSFYGKIHLGYALGLYDETTRENLDIIRRIRNAFAHTPQAIDFNTDAVRDEVDRLNAVVSTDAELATFSEHRRKFTGACGTIIVRARFDPIGKRFELMRKVLEAVKPHVTGELQNLVPDASEKLAAAVEAIKKLK